MSHASGSQRERWLSRGLAELEQPVPSGHVNRGSISDLQQQQQQQQQSNLLQFFRRARQVVGDAFSVLWQTGEERQQRGNDRPQHAATPTVNQPQHAATPTVNRPQHAATPTVNRPHHAATPTVNQPHHGPDTAATTPSSTVRHGPQQEADVVVDNEDVEQRQYQQLWAQLWPHHGPNTAATASSSARQGPQQEADIVVDHKEVQQRQYQQLWAQFWPHHGPNTAATPSSTARQGPQQEAEVVVDHEEVQQRQYQQLWAQFWPHHGPNTATTPSSSTARQGPQQEAEVEQLRPHQQQWVQLWRQRQQRVQQAHRQLGGLLDEDEIYSALFDDDSDDDLEEPPAPHPTGLSQSVIDALPSYRFRKDITCSVCLCAVENGERMLKCHTCGYLHVHARCVGDARSAIEQLTCRACRAQETAPVAGESQH